MPARRASVYISVLGASMLTSVLVLSAMLSHRVQNNRLRSTDDLQRARLAAQTALKLGMLRIENDPDWRYNYPNGLWETAVRLSSLPDSATLSIRGEDPEDGDLVEGEGQLLFWCRRGRQRRRLGGGFGRR